MRIFAFYTSFVAVLALKFIFMIRLIHIVGILACLFSNFSCQYKSATSHASGTIDSASCYTNPLLSIGGPAFLVPCSITVCIITFAEWMIKSVCGH